MWGVGYRFDPPMTKPLADVWLALGLALAIGRARGGGHRARGSRRAPGSPRREAARAATLRSTRCATADLDDAGRPAS